MQHGNLHFMNFSRFIANFYLNVLLILFDIQFVFQRDRIAFVAKIIFIGYDFPFVFLWFALLLCRI